MVTNPLIKLKGLGQSIWLDYIQRAILDNGTLARFVSEDGISGVTTNPAIFEKAILIHRDYDDAIAKLVKASAKAREIYQKITIEDVCAAADLLRPIYDATNGQDGYVSIEVSPHFADDTETTIAEAVNLWDRVNRSNLMIKIPATTAGVLALRRLVTLGINVNITLIFGLKRYRDIVGAYIAGLEDCVASGQQIAYMASVASFFLSRIDTSVDARLDAIETIEARALRGKAAIACARMAYQEHKKFMKNKRWKELAQRGARPQRLLWASTGTKDPGYSDIKYVEALIGPGTITTLPPDTVKAYRNHGNPIVRLEDELDESKAVVERLSLLGVNLDTVATTLEREGIQKFIEPYDRVIQGLNRSIRGA